MKTAPSGSWRFALLAVVALCALIALCWPQAASERGTTFEQLLAPLRPGGAVVNGYFLSSARRGEEHDIVLVARRPATDERPSQQVQIHVLDRGRWSGVRETRSYGIAWELPKSDASREDCEAVTQAIAAAIGANDRVAGRVVDIALAAEPSPPWMSRVLERVTGWRGALVAAFLLTAMIALAQAPGGGIAAALVLGALGIALRIAHVGLPFVRDQDVQRAFTANLPLSEVLFGAGLRDRHPPLYFVLLHGIQWLGQDEATLRAPAAVLGGLIGPAILGAIWLVRRRVDATAVLVSVAVTLSPVLVDRSREVSEIPLFAFLAVVMSASLARAVTHPSRAALCVVGVSHALAFWTYYLAPPLVAGQLAALLFARSKGRAAARAALIGSIAGLPAMILGAVTLVRDYHARRAADHFPELAWGSRQAWSMPEYLLAQALEALGPLALAAFVSLLLAALMRRRDVVVLIPVLGFVATAVALVVLTPVARLQPYYIAAVMPLLALAVGLIDEPAGLAHRLRVGVVGFAILMLTATRVAPLRLLYLPSAEAIGPQLAAIIAARPERLIALTAHYDATLLAYYLARRVEADVAWTDLAVDAQGAIRLSYSPLQLHPLVHGHQMNDDSDAAAVHRLKTAAAQGPVLVVEREMGGLTRLPAALQRCEVLMDFSIVRLRRCEEQELH